MAAILSKSTVLCLSSYFAVLFCFTLKLILFYHRVVYSNTRIFLILLWHPVNKLFDDAFGKYFGVYHDDHFDNLTEYILHDNKYLRN